MNTQTNAAETPKQEEKPAQIDVKLAPVMPMQKPTVATETWNNYCAQVAKGLPTKNKDKTPILAARISAYALTDAQRKQLQEARRDYRKSCMASKKTILNVLRAKTTHTVAHRETGRGGAVRYVKEKAFKSKNHFKAYVEGVPVASLQGK